MSQLLYCATEKGLCFWRLATPQPFPYGAGHCEEALKGLQVEGAAMEEVDSCAGVNRRFLCDVLTKKK